MRHPPKRLPDVVPYVLRGYAFDGNTYPRWPDNPYYVENGDARNLFSVIRITCLFFFTCRLFPSAGYKRFCGIIIYASYARTCPSWTPYLSFFAISEARSSLPLLPPPPRPRPRSPSPRTYYLKNSPSPAEPCER